MRYRLRDGRALLIAAALLPSAARAEESPAKPVGAPVKVSAGSEGFVLQSADGDYRLRVGGYVQGDGRFFASDADKLGIDTFLLRRARPQLQGTLAKRFDFYFMSDFGGGTAVVQDAYLDARFSPLLRLRVGKFKPPVGLERLQSGIEPAVRRARRCRHCWCPTATSAIQLARRRRHRRLRLCGLAAERHRRRRQQRRRHERRQGARRPRLPPAVQEAAGSPLAASASASPGRSGSRRARPCRATARPGQLTFFSYRSGVTFDGTRQRLSPQGYFYVGPFGLLAEYVRLEHEAARRTACLVQVRNEAWQVAASFVLTGEKAAFTAVTPAKPFDPAKGQWGAFELAARVHQLEGRLRRLRSRLRRHPRSPRAGPRPGRSASTGT